MDWSFILWGVGAVLAGFFLMWLVLSIKAIKDPDVQAASKLGMDIRRFHKYQEIFDEQCECHRNGTPIPDRTAEIPNMNEWYRYGEWRLEKDKEEFRKQVYEETGIKLD